jgi:hypothetical protein
MKKTEKFHLQNQKTIFSLSLSLFVYDFILFSLLIFTLRFYLLFIAFKFYIKIYFQFENQFLMIKQILQQLQKKKISIL